MSGPTRSMQLQKLYVHDDRIAPYALATVTPYQVKNVKTMPDLEGLRFETCLAVVRRSLIFDDAIDEVG